MPRTMSLAAFVVAVLASAAAAGPAEDVLRHIPDDYGFCVFLRDIRGRSGDLAESPLGRAVFRSPRVIKMLASKEWQDLIDFEKNLTKQLGVDVATLRDDVLGDAVAFVYRPGPPGKPEQEQGLFVARPREPKTLAKLIDKVNQLQKETGELKSLDEVAHNGVTYVRRTEAKENTFYLLQGGVFLFTAQEPLLKAAIDRAKTAKADAGVAAQLRELDLHESTLAVVVNPRAWDAEMAAGTAAATWKALTAAGAGVRLDQDPVIKLGIRAKRDALPESAKRFLATAAKPADLVFPERALLSVAAGIDVAAAYEYAAGMMGDDHRKKLERELERGLGALLGKNVVTEILPSLGPDVGFCLMPPAGKGWTPSALAAVRLKPGPSGDADEAVLSGVQWWAQMAVLGHNKSHPKTTVALKTRVADKVKVRFADGDGMPEGFRPAFALKEGWLLAATSPDEIAAFKAPPAATGGVVLARLSAKAWRAYLSAKREPLAEFFAAADKIPKTTALARLDETRDWVDWFDAMTLRQDSRGDAVVWSLVVSVRGRK